MANNKANTKKATGIDFRNRLNKMTKAQIIDSIGATLDLIEDYDKRYSTKAKEASGQEEDYCIGRCHSYRHASRAIRMMLCR